MIIMNLVLMIRYFFTWLLVKLVLITRPLLNTSLNSRLPLYLFWDVRERPFSLLLSQSFNKILYRFVEKLFTFFFEYLRLASLALLSDYIIDNASI